MSKCVDVEAGVFTTERRTYKYGMLRCRREPFGSGLELEVLV